MFENKPRLLDLFCCQGGAHYGYEQAGFEVTGVDIEPQPKHASRFTGNGIFIQADAIDFLLEHGEEYDAIHASPPCQKYSMSSMQFRLLGKQYPNLVEATRVAMAKFKKPTVIENVPGAPLINPIILCGSMFNIPTYRHRLFETNWGLQAPIHPVHNQPNAKMGRPIKKGEFIQYVGHFPGVQYVRDFTECQWMDQYGLAQSIPPQYTKHIGIELIKYINS